MRCAREANKRLPPRGRDALRKYAGGIVGTGVLDGPISGEQACLANWAAGCLRSRLKEYAHRNNYHLNRLFTQLLPSLPTANPPPSAGRHGRGRRLDVPCISKQWTALSITASGELPLVALTPTGFDTSVASLRACALLTPSGFDTATGTTLNKPNLI